MIRVLICDDAAAFSILVREWIAEGGPDLEVVGTASSGAELLDMLGSVDPDVVVLDHLLGAMESDELTPLIRSQHADVGIVLISAMPADALADLATRARADAYVSKATRPEDLCDAIRQAAMRRAGARSSRLN